MSVVLARELVHRPHCDRDYVVELADTARPARSPAELPGLRTVLSLDARLKAQQPDPLINHRGYGHHSAAAVISMIYLCCGGITVELPTEK